MDNETAKRYGIDIEKGLKSCLNNPVFYRKIISLFLQDTCFSRAKAAYVDNNYDTLFESLHELKGVSGNAGLIRLYDAIVPLVELLRNGTDDFNLVECLFTEVEESYHHTLEGISLYLEG